MQITLNQDEINDAIEIYVRDQITINENQTIDIDMKAGRGENGNSAIIDIRPKLMKANKPKTRSTSAAEPADAPSPSKTTKPAPEKAQEEVQEELEAEAPEEKPAKPETASKTTTIFGKGSADESPDESPEEPEAVEQAEAAETASDEAPSRTSIFSKAKAG